MCFCHCRGSAQRLHDIQGHGIFDDGVTTSPRRVSDRKKQDIQGSYKFSPEANKVPVVMPGSPRAKKLDDMRSRVFSAASEVLTAKQQSQAKQALLNGSSDDAYRRE
jgi:hypothetical protein